MIQLFDLITRNFRKKLSIIEYRSTTSFYSQGFLPGGGAAGAIL